MATLMRNGESLPIFVMSRVDGNNRTVAAIYEHACEVISLVWSVQNLGPKSASYIIYRNGCGITVRASQSVVR